MQKLAFLISNLLLVQVFGQQCSVGWPVIFAGSERDGDTEVTFWWETPNSNGGMTEYLIGGRSTSASFLEQDDEICRTLGCAFTVKWSKFGTQLEDHRVYTDVNTVASIAYDESTETVAVLFLKIQTATTGQYVLQMNTWNTVRDRIEYNEITYKIIDSLDLIAYSPTQTMMIAHNGLFHLYGNKPDTTTIYNYWAKVDQPNDATNPGRIVEFWTTDFESDDAFFRGRGNRIYEIGFGYDNENILQLASLAYPKGRTGLDDTQTLGSDTNYNVILSRTFTEYGIGNGLEFDIKIYGFRQAYPSLYYYYKKFALASIRNAAGILKSDVFLHLAGQHSTYGNQILLSTFIYKGDVLHSLQFENSRIFTADGNTKVLSVTTMDTADVDELWYMYVYYVETNISNRGKVLYTNMETSFEVVNFYFQQDIQSIVGSAATMKVQQFAFLKEYDMYMMGGKANFIKGHGDESSLTFDWTDTKRYFGYFNVWTTNEVCYTQFDKDDLDWGPRYQEYLDGLLEVDMRLIQDTFVGIVLNDTINQWNMGDYDAEDWDEIILEQKRIDELGFRVEYRSWRYKDDEDGEQYLMFPIDGKNWVQRFTTRTSTEFRGKARDGDLSILALGVWGAVQTGFGIAILVLFMLPNLNNVDAYWGAWCLAFSVVIGMETGLFVVWPTTYFGQTSKPLAYAWGFAVASMAGPYGLYEISLLYLFLVLWAFPDEAGYVSTGTLSDAETEKILWGVLLAVDYGINTAFTFLFGPGVKKYYDYIKSVEDEEEQAVKDAEQQTSFNFDDNGEVTEGAQVFF